MRCGSPTTSSAIKPDPDYSAGQAYDLDTFTYRAYDGLQYSAPATMSFWVAPINDAPTFTPGAGTVTVDKNSGAYSGAWATNISPGPTSESWQSVTFDVDVDLNGVPNLFDVAPAIAPTGPSRSRRPAGEVGLVHVTVRAVDDGGLEDWDLTGQTAPDDTSDDVTFDIVVAFGPVDAVDDSATIDEDVVPSPAGIDVLANDNVPVGYTVTGVTQGTLGTVTIQPGGLGVNYAPAANTHGADSFTYTLE